MAVPQKRYQGLMPEGAVSRKQLKAAITACTRWEEVGKTLPAFLPRFMHLPRCSVWLCMQE